MLEGLDKRVAWLCAKAMETMGVTDSEMSQALNDAAFSEMLTRFVEGGASDADPPTPWPRPALCQDAARCPPSVAFPADMVGNAGTDLIICS